MSSSVVRYNLNNRKNLICSLLLILFGSLLAPSYGWPNKFKMIDNLNWLHEKITQGLLNQDKSSSHCVASFHDSMLPGLAEHQLAGVDHHQGLGRIIRIPNLDGFKIEPSRVADIRAKFDIITRYGNAKKQEFKHMSRPILEHGDIDLCNKTDHHPLNLSALKESNFDPNRPTVMLIPGYLSGDSESWMDDIAEQWLKLKDVNVILVTWKSANQKSYENAIANTRYISRQIVIFLYYILHLSSPKSKGNIRNVLENKQFLDQLHIIGHSCGAHIAGFVGKELAGSVGRISGLDPAGPHFDQFIDEPHYRLFRTDAKLVDVYHSNMGKLDRKTVACSYVLDKFYESLGKDWMCPAMNVGVDADPKLPGSWFGFEQPIGHLDFYLNNGHKQPGCKDRAHICDHERAHDLVLDLLVNQLMLKNQAPRVSDRPLAFRAPDYDSFKMGAAFQENGCPWILDEPGQRLRRSPGSLKLESCSVPLDFESSPAEYRAELENKHGLKLQEQQKSQRYYFATSSEMSTKESQEVPLTLDHFVIKLKIGFDPRWHLDKCRLNIKGAFEGDELSFEMKNLKISKNTQLQLDTLVAVPFNHPRGLDLRLNPEIQQLMNNPEDSSTWWRSIEGQPAIGYILPTKLSIYSSEIRSSSSSNDNDSPFGIADGCNIAVSYVAVEPLWNNAKSFHGIYRKPTTVHDDEIVMQTTNHLENQNKSVYRHKVYLEKSRVFNPREHEFGYTIEKNPNETNSHLELGKIVVDTEN